MKTSTDRILTTHTGSLPRPKPLIDLDLAAGEGRGHRARAVRSRDGESRRRCRFATGRGRHRHCQRRRDVEAVLHHLYPPPRRRHRARSARRRKGPRHHDRPRSSGASGFRPQREFHRGAVSRLRRRVALQGSLGARPRHRASAGRCGEGATDRRVHDGAVAGHPDALHHQSALPDRRGLCRGARRDDEDRIPRHRRRRFRAADRCARPRLGAQQPVPASERRRIPFENRRAQYRGAQRRDRRAARRPYAAAYLLGQLRRPAYSRSAGDKDHRHRV